MSLLNIKKIRNATIAVCCIVIPWLVGNLIVFQFDTRNYESKRINHNLKHKEISNSFVMIGDCTVSPYDWIAKNSDNIRIIGFGGSNLQEWYFLIKNNHSFFKNSGKIIIATSHPSRFFTWYSVHTSYAPTFMEFTDFKEHVIDEKDFSLTKSAQFLLAMFLPAYASSQDNRMFLMNKLFPFYQKWNDEYFRISGAIAEKSRSLENKSTTWYNPPHDEMKFLRKIPDLEKSTGAEIILMITPRTKRMISETYLADKSKFLNFCQALHLKCIDNSQDLPDSFFPTSSNGDGLHLAPESLESYLHILLSRHANREVRNKIRQY